MFEDMPCPSGSVPNPPWQIDNERTDNHETSCSAACQPAKSIHGASLLGTN